MIDDQTTAYILAVQAYFEDLKQVAAQLAGLLVLEDALKAALEAADKTMTDW